MQQRFRPRLAALLAILAILSGAWLTERLALKQARLEREKSVWSQLATVRARLEGEINANLLLIRGLVAEISIDPDLSQQRFSKIASELMRQKSALRHIVAAPDLVVSMVHPLAGNEAAIGLDYRHHPQQRDAAMKVIESGEIIVAGPLNLVQGGVGFVARTPVYSNQGASNGQRKLWGLLASVLDADALYQHSQLFDLNNELNIAIRGKDASGAEGAVFFGDETLFDESPVSMKVQLPHGSWQMAAAPKDGWRQTPDSVWMIRWAALLAAALAGYAAFQRSAGRIRRQQANVAIENSEKKFRGIFENANDGIFIIEPEERRISEVNGSATRYLGYSREELTAMRVDDLDNSATPQQLKNCINKVRQSGALLLRTTHRHKNGQQIPVEISLRLVDIDGKPMLITVARDISERLRAEHKLQRLSNHLKTLYDASPDLIFLLSEDGELVDINSNACRAFGYPRQAALSMPLEHLFTDAESFQLAHEKMLEALQHGDSEFELLGRPREGEPFPVNIRLRSLKSDENTTQARILAVARDITRSKQKEAALLRSEQRLADAIESISEGFALWDSEDRLELCNSRYRQLFGDGQSFIKRGVSFAQVLRQSLQNKHMLAPLPMEDWIRLRTQEHQYGGGAHEIQSADGRSLRVSEQATSDGGIVSIYSDITEIRQAEENIRYRAFFDILTGLPNRASFVETLEAAVADTARNKEHIALLFIDLDRFKNVNDALGHDMGDQLLQEAGRRIQDCVRQTDCVARLGGDEFTVLLKHLDKDLQATMVAEAIIERLAQPYSLQHHEVYAGASIGITVCPADGAEGSTLLKNADLAMFRAKEQGRNTFCYFTREMTDKAQRFVALEKDLRRSLELQHFIVYFQPLVRASDRRLVGAEALLRWSHPEKGMISPAFFIPVAEETRLIVPLGEWVLRESCRQAMQWSAASDGEQPYLSVNVSSRQFHGGFGREVVTQILRDTGFPAQRLVFEITESLLMEEDERVSKALLEFRQMGIGLAVDDFGTGFSSLSYLRRFPLTSLKIDYSFVRDMEVDPADAQLVESIVVMAQRLKLKVIAEGVETQGQADMLQALSCDLLQGFLFSRPVPLVELNQLLEKDAL